jgi:hypothetical protein
MLCCLPSQLSAQAHNGEVYQQLIRHQLAAHTDTLSSLKGTVIAAWLPEWIDDSTANQTLSILTPVISSQLLGKDSVIRSLELRFQWEGKTGLLADQESHRDTLSRADFRRVWRESPLELRGEDPRKLQRWGKPFALVGGSILLIVSLFYLRSQ